MAGKRLTTQEAMDIYARPLAIAVGILFVIPCLLITGINAGELSNIGIFMIRASVVVPYVFCLLFTRKKRHEYAAWCRLATCAACFLVTTIIIAGIMPV